MIATTLPYKTPIVPCNGMNQENEIFIKRDDLLPFSFGGNKARIAWEFLEDMRLKGANCLIGYGSTKSNLSRVLANACCARGIKCHIIAADDVSDVMKETNNHTIVNMCGAVVHRCSKANVAQTVERVWRLCEEEGYKPYYIYGNKCGVGNEAIPVNAYVKAHSEIAEPFDYIFLATGTGMTQAGLIAGARLEQTHEKIVGISIARPREQVMAVVRTYLNAYYATRGTTSEVNDDVNVIDFCQGGGYGMCTPEILSVIREMLRHNGIALDPTYTGKAFTGLLTYLREKCIVGKRILFIHTGGLPLFFDEIRTICALR